MMRSQMSQDPYQSPSSPPPMPPSPVGLGNDAGMRYLLPVGRSGWAIAAGYLGLFSLVILPAPVALVISIVAIRDIRRSSLTPNPKFGMGRAVFGLIMGLLGTGVLIAVVITNLRD
jgi:hypothetical protein